MSTKTRIGKLERNAGISLEIDPMEELIATWDQILNAVPQSCVPDMEADVDRIADGAAECGNCDEWLRTASDLIRSKKWKGKRPSLNECPLCRKPVQGRSESKP